MTTRVAPVDAEAPAATDEDTGGETRRSQSQNLTALLDRRLSMQNKRAEQRVEKESKQSLGLRSVLSRTDLIRMVLALPVVCFALVPLLFGRIEIDVPWLAKPMAAKDTSVLYFNTEFLWFQLIATVLGLLSEAVRRRRLATSSLRPVRMRFCFTGGFSSERSADAKEKLAKAAEEQARRLETARMETTGDGGGGEETSCSPMAEKAGLLREEADAAANEVSSMLTWTSFDCFEAVAYAFFVGLGAYPHYGLIYAVLLGLCAPLACSILAKRLINSMVLMQHDRFSAWVTSTAIPLMAFGLFVDIVLTFAMLIVAQGYPYPHARADDGIRVGALSEMLAVSNYSRIMCDEEAAFRASFVLPFHGTYKNWLGAEFDLELDCDDALCGYRTWQDLCEARRVASLADSTYLALHYTIVDTTIILLLIVALEGTGHITRGRDGLQFRGAHQPHMMMFLCCNFVMVISWLTTLTRCLLQAPLAMLGHVPMNPRSYCPRDSFCHLVAHIGWKCGVASLPMLALDTLSQHLKSRGSSFFLSYKQNDGNDGVVMQLAQLLPGGPYEPNVWLDKLAKDRSESGMTAGVRQSKIFVAIISPAYFQSWFCCLEMHTALKEGKPIMVVWNQSKQPVQAALGWIPKPLKMLMDNEFLPIQEDVQMAMPCVERIVEECSELSKKETEKQEIPIEHFQVKRSEEKQGLGAVLDVERLDREGFLRRDKEGEGDGPDVKKSS